jgi:hypothetical protein
VLDNPGGADRSAMLASRSDDGGLSWSEPVTLASEATTDLGLDKCTLTADPTRPGTAYAVWDLLAGLDGLTGTTGPAWMTRTTDGGAHWEPPWKLYDPGLGAQTISSQIVVQPDDGALVNLLVIITGLDGGPSTVAVAVLRSLDAGTNWTGPFTGAAWRSVGVRDPRDGRAIRGGDLVPAVAVDRTSGALYAAWQDGRFSGDPLKPSDAIAFARSTDGGVHWSEPVLGSLDPAVPAFTPALAVADDGRVALGYYDWTPPPGGAPGLWTTRWLRTSADGGATWDEPAPVGGPFDLRLAPQAGGWFLGDYTGLVGGATGFTSLFAMTRPADGQGATDLYLGPPQP